MKLIISYIRQYFIETDKRVLSIITLFTAILIFINYHFKLDDSIYSRRSFGYSFVTRYCIFLIAFAIPYIVYQLFRKRNYITKPSFIFLLLLAPAIYSLKMALRLLYHLSDNYNWNNYWNHIVYWPVLVIITASILFIVWKFFNKDQPFYGIKTKGLDWKPYLLMLLIMLPLIGAASTQQDFLAMYPKIQSIHGLNYEPGVRWWHKLLFELSYGSDFITIELFFRGFLVLAFVKWAGKDAILPMACFYCTIHFGKPLGECISSYFGGMLLGIVVYNTRSIFGGLVVHLGIAWMMELGGYIGNSI